LLRGWRRRIGLEDCDRLVHHCLRAFGIRKKIRVWKGSSMKWPQAGPEDVELPWIERHAVLAVHEVCHVVSFARRMRSADHCPRFMRMYLDLLSRMLRIQLRALELDAERFGVEVAPRRAAPQLIRGARAPEFLHELLGKGRTRKSKKRGKM
jgi:hypothetical protein